MGQLIVVHNANIGTIKEINIHGRSPIPCEIINGESSDPIELPNGHYTATVTIIIDGKPITEDITFDIFNNTDTIYTIGLPPGVSPIRRVEH